MKKIVTFILALTILFSLCSCDKHVSSYKALGLVRNNTRDSCYASFLSLEGKLVFKLNKSDSTGAEGDISYSVKVDAGEVSVYYDVYGNVEQLALVSAGESAEDRGGYVEAGQTVYIIIEAKDGAKGSVTVKLN